MENKTVKPKLGKKDSLIDRTTINPETKKDKLLVELLGNLPRDLILPLDLELGANFHLDIEATGVQIYPQNENSEIQGIRFLNKNNSYEIRFNRNAKWITITDEIGNEYHIHRYKHW